MSAGAADVEGTVTLEQVRRVADLANLELTPDEEPRMQRDLNAILQHVAQLAELDTTHVKPMAQVSDLLSDQVGDLFDFTAGTPEGGVGAALRLDAVRPSIDRRAVMASAPETDGRFFKVPKVIER